MSPEPGSKLGHYEIRSKLGEGGMGEVYLAKETQLDREVAIKFLPLNLIEDEHARKRLLREARAAAKLDHPNICSIYEVGEAEGRSFICMQYVDGETLDARIRREPLNVLESLSIATQVADALAEAHAHRIIHRDIKPLNIMITPRGQAKVMDFGLARYSSEEVATEAETQTLLTAPGTVIGTVPYMSPEQVRGDQVDTRTDIFSFGTMLYEMLSGRQPFAAQSAAETASAILTREPPPLARFAPEVPEELQRIVLKCLEKNRDQRFQSARELVIDLENIKRRSESSQGTFETPEAAKVFIEPPSPYKWKSHLRLWLVLAAAGLVVLIGAGAAYLLLFRPAHIASAAPIQSLAVLPLENLSGDSAQDYFADGMTEALTTELAKIGALRVISRTSAMQYKGAHKALPEIGRELNVDGIIEGSVVRSGNRVKVTVQLIRAVTDQHIWAEDYIQDLSDILVLQKNVARDIAREVRIQLTAPDTARLSIQAKVNPEAHDLYLRGWFYRNQGTRESLERAREYFQQALDKDPRYAPAYAGLADYYSVLPFYTDARPDDVFPKAKQAVANALELDTSLAEAHGIRAYILTYYDWDWVAADREFQIALALNPNDAGLRHRYSRYLSSVGRIDDALREIERARLLDPNSLLIKDNVGVIYYFARQYDQTIVILQSIPHDHPESSTAHWGIGLAYEQKGQYDLALPELEKAATSKSTNALASLGHLYGLMDRKRDAEQILAELKARGSQENVSGYQFALVEVGLGDHEAAIAALQQAYQERSTLLSYLKMDPRFDPLRANLQFQELLRHIGIPQ
jgi:TolB-like protein/Tfp pilus assembly protein PilF/predicted Ser/Thr protein kinase